MRRHRLLVLEKSDVVLEYSGGMGSAFTSTGVDDIMPSGDAIEDEKLRAYMIRKAQEEAIARERRMKRLRKLARMDFKLLGGVSPVGFTGGAGGSSGGFRPGSMSARS